MYLGTRKVPALVGTPADVADALRQLYGQDAGEPSCHGCPVAATSCKPGSMMIIELWPLM